LRVLLTEEVTGRDEATRRQHRRAAGLPAGKTFASWREHDSSIPAPTQQALATLEWIGRAENLAVTGPSGTGRVIWSKPSRTPRSTRTPSRLVHPRIVDRHGRESRRGRLGRPHHHQDHPSRPDRGRRHRHAPRRPSRRRSALPRHRRRLRTPLVAVTSNLHPSGFDTIMPKTLATATVDRLLHHAHIVLTEGTSLRLAEATAGKGVIPLT